MKAFLLKIWDLVDDFVLELGRTALIGAYSAVLALVLAKLQVLEAGEWGQVAVVLGLVLKGIDRHLHEKKILTKGITGF